MDLHPPPSLFISYNYACKEKCDYSTLLNQLPAEFLGFSAIISC